MSRRPIVIVLTVLVSLLASSVPALAAAYPNSMAATGDSITRAYNTGWFPFSDAPQNSWSTGTTSTVNSHYLRILAKNSLIKGKNYNDAKSGAKMADLNGQIVTVNSQQVGYVTVLMGGNDVCTSSVATMTSVADFAAQFTNAMQTVTSGSPNALVYVVSIPDAYQLWKILHTNSSAVATWNFFKICQSLLANPTSVDPADEARRQSVRQRNIDFNAKLWDICKTYARCRFDGNAVFNYPFQASDVSTRDYFHPSLSGQKNLAAVSWSAGYWGP